MVEKIPKEIQKYFIKISPKFSVSTFEEMMLQDIYSYDEQSKIKLNRDVTKELLEEIEIYIKEKRNIRYSVKGETRDGKSLTSLKIISIILEKNNQNFNDVVNEVVCGNQIEYRQKLLNANFGDSFLIDENFFTRAGLGANIESDQLKDFNSIIAKKNISAIYINPSRFLNVGATLGISTYGRDSKQWLSRVLIYKFKDNFPYLIGYAIIDVGGLFRKYGCYIYKFTGGCNNVKQLKLKDIPKEIITFSNCIPKKIDKKKIIDDRKVCPFYNVCNHGLCKYEHKKDSWIDKEMQGGLDERTHERFKLSLLLILELYNSLENEIIKLNAKNGKDLKNRVKIKLPKYTNTKMGIGEFDEFLEIIKTNCDLEMLVETMKTINDKKINDLFFNLDCGNEINKIYNSKPLNL